MAFYLVLSLRWFWAPILEGTRVNIFSTYRARKLSLTQCELTSAEAFVHTMHKNQFTVQEKKKKRRKNKFVELFMLVQ